MCLCVYTVRETQSNVQEMICEMAWHGVFSANGLKNDVVPLMDWDGMTVMMMVTLELFKVTFL